MFRVGDTVHIQETSPSMVQPCYPGIITALYIDDVDEYEDGLHIIQRVTHADIVVLGWGPRIGTDSFLHVPFDDKQAQSIGFHQIRDVRECGNYGRKMP